MDSMESGNKDSTPSSNNIPASAMTLVHGQQFADRKPSSGNLAPLSIDSLQDGRVGCRGVLTWPEGRCPNNSIPDEVAQDLDFVVVLGGKLLQSPMLS
jgi:hypothetical protein